MASVTRIFLISVLLIHTATSSVLPRYLLDTPADDQVPDTDVAQAQPGGKIVGGELADIKNFPYQLSLQVGGAHACGASIISADWALTAAHCVVGVSASSLQVRAGSSYYASGGSVHKVTQVTAHSSFSESTKDYDIAAVKVSPQFTFSTTVKAISLSSSTPSQGTLAVVSGWGFTYDGENKNSDQLRQVSVPVISNASCNKDNYPNEITPRMFCAGYANGGKDACQNDSGGPLVVSGVQVGVVSWGVSCAAPTFPGVYADVAVLRSWIKSTTGV